MLSGILARRLPSPSRHYFSESSLGSESTDLRLSREFIFLLEDSFRILFHLMKSMDRFLLFVLGYIFFSCNTASAPNTASEDYTIIEFSIQDVPIKATLAGKKYTFEEIVAPENIIIVNNLLVLADGDQKKMVHLVDVKNNQYVRKYGKYGEGPGEMGSVSDLLPGFTPGSFWDL